MAYVTLFLFTSITTTEWRILFYWKININHKKKLNKDEHEKHRYGRLFKLSALECMSLNTGTTNYILTGNFRMCSLSFWYQLNSIEMRNRKYIPYIETDKVDHFNKRWVLASCIASQYSGSDWLNYLSARWAQRRRPGKLGSRDSFRSSPMGGALSTRACNNNN